jgi:phage-related protein (TIGR01555 family)
LANAPAEVKAHHNLVFDQAKSSGVFDEAGSLLSHTIEMGFYPSTYFLGYSFLSKLMENGIIRACVTSVVDDMLRNWIDVVRIGDNDNVSGDEEKLKRLKEAMKKFKIRDVLHKAALLTGYFGGCLIFLNTGDMVDIALPLDLSSKSSELKPGCPLSFTVVEPINVCPGFYNAFNPLDENFYKPDDWIVMGRKVHSSRLLKVHGPLPVQLLLPSYNFFGIPQAQVLWDYVMHFQRDRLSASNLLNKFSTKVLKTDMSDVMLNKGVGDKFFHRLKLFNEVSNNDGVLALDKEKEDFIKVESTLGGVTDIVQQSLELICAVNSTPVVKTLGLSPKGFNATGEIDLRNYYDRISALQEQQLAPVLEVILKILQLHLFGEIDDYIGFNFLPLSEEDRQVKATVQKTIAETASVYLDRGVVSSEEVRQNLIADKDSGFDDIKLEDLPDETLGEGFGLLGENIVGPVSGFPSVPGPGMGPATLPTGLTPQQQALNGGQITSLLEILNFVAQGQIPRASGVALIMSAFNMSREQSEALMDQIGQGFMPSDLPDREEGGWQIKKAR